MKRRPKATWEGEEKPIGGSAIFGAAPEKKANKTLQKQEHQKTAGPDPLTNQMMDSLERYKENIATSSMEMAVNGGLCAELAASLVISVDTFARQQQEIKLLSEWISALKKRETKAINCDTFPKGTTVCTNYEAVGQTKPHRKNACYFDQCKMTDRKDVGRKFMDKKGVACKDDE